MRAYQLLPVVGSVLAAPVLQTPALPISSGLQSILDNTDNSDLYHYPTDWTRGIIPKPIHSHNDYWRDLPFWSALSVGAASVEADVWLFNDTLLVGHEEAALTPARTLDSLYIQPILSVLQRTNPNSPYVDPSSAPNGVFDTSSGQTLALFIDVKTPGPSTWPSVVAALAPLRDAGYLTTYNGTGVTSGPVTVIGTGNTPQSNFTDATQFRDYFFDADLSKLGDEQSNITAAISPVASTQFTKYVGEINGTSFNETQLGVVREQVGRAREKGIMARYWDTPGWPIGTRNAVWQTLVDEGVGLLNADDLRAAAGFVGSTEPFQ